MRSVVLSLEVFLYKKKPRPLPWLDAFTTKTLAQMK
jgi:hypothetical protein